MKRIFLFILMAVMLEFAGCDSRQVTEKNIIDIAYNSLSGPYKIDVTNKDTPNVEVFENFFKVTFNAKSQAMLGPIVVTVSKKTLSTSTSLRD